MKSDVLIIGGGVTGTGLARDLALRGVSCILVEQRDVDAGASGANHGLLHSGARYVSNDPHSAMQCRAEGELLRRLAPHCIENTGGLFVAVAGDDEKFIADFSGHCAKSEVPCRALSVREARELEPALSGKLIAAYAVEDGSVDPFKLSVENMAEAKGHGATLLPYTKAVALSLENRRIRSVTVEDTRTGKQETIEATEVVNAAGAWSGIVAALAGIKLNILFSKGTLLITQTRIGRRVINRLRKPSNADIIVPGGTVSVLGTTSLRVDSLADIRPTVDEVELIMDETTAMVPALAEMRIMRSFAGVRPLVAQVGETDDRNVSRDFTLLDHGADGVSNFVTITGGKLTTYRYMAEKAADMVCAHLGVTAPCRTGDAALPASCPWTVPGLAPRRWLDARQPNDVFLCECEMVPVGVVDDLVLHILEKGRTPTLNDIGLRSRVGKGSCQGSYCGARVLGHLYQSGHLSSGQGREQLREFLRERWKGEQPIFWGTQLAQAELKEALHCGLWGLELPDGGGE